MAKRPPDDSFRRDGRELSAWLGDLVSDDASQRIKAGEALQAMLYRVPSLQTDWEEIDWGFPPETINHLERFQRQVRAAIADPAFPTSAFVPQLIARRIGLKDDWHQRVERAFKQDEVPSEYETRLTQRIQNASNEAEREKATRRFTRWVCAKEARDFRRNQSHYANAESMTAAGVMSSVVFEALDEALLADRAGLWMLLNDEAMFQEAAGALVRIGPAAVEFAGFFLARMSSRESPHGFDGAAALGSIGREDPAVIDTLVQGLRAGTPSVRIGSAQALGYAGPPLAGRLEVALDLLLNATHEPALAYVAIPALASVGRGSLVAMQRVVELAAPQPPRWRAHESYPEYRYDEVMHGRGIAIEALVQFQMFANQVTPTLIEAFDSFEEYDPDQSYHGEHARVCDALAAFGADAASIVPRLIKFLDAWWERPDSDRTWPDDIFRLLVAIGPAAARALPALERFHIFQASEDESPLEPLDPSVPLHQAILALRDESP